MGFSHNRAQTVLVFLLVVLVNPTALAQQFRAAPRSPFTTHAGPRAAKFADVNGDGKADIVSFNSAANNIQVFLGAGDGSFVEAPDSPVAGLAHPTSGEFADFNGDGHVDIAVASSTSGTTVGVNVLLGDGAGRFTPASGSPYPVGGEVGGIAVGDFNNDGNIDIAATISNSNEIMVLLGDGTGRFSERPDGKIPTISPNPILIFAIDFNEDRNIDLIVTTSSGLVLFAGDGHGNFAKSGISPPGGPVSGLIPADMNRDGHIDLVTTQAGSPGSVSVLLGNGTGIFAPAPGTPVVVGNAPMAATAGDFNRDGALDVVVANAGDHTFSLLLGSGTGRLTNAPGSPYSAGVDFPTGVDSRDLNSDGIPDLLFSDFSNHRISALLSSSPALTFKPRSLSFYGQVGGVAKSIPVALTVSATTPAVPLTITSNQPWLLATPSAGNTSTVPGTVTVTATPGALPPGVQTATLTVSAPGFASSTIQVSFHLARPSLMLTPAPNSPISDKLGPDGIVVADFNGDGRQDVAVSTDKTASLYAGDGTGQFSPAPGSPYPAGGTTYPPAVGDLNGDGLPDLVVPSSGSDTITIYFGQSGGGLRIGSTIPVGRGPRFAAIGDVNLDGFQDILVADYTSDDVIVLLGDGTGNFTPSSASPILNVSKQFGSLKIIDANGDGLPDILASDSSSKGAAIVVPGDGMGGFDTRSEILLPSGTGTQELASADFNQDGWPDIVVAGYSANNVYIWLNDGTGQFTPAPGSPIALGRLPWRVTTGDFNGDGIVDIAVTVNINTIQILFGNGDGTFRLAASTLAITNPSGIGVGDINGDGLTDLIVPSFVSDSIAVLLGSLVPTATALTTTVTSPVSSGSAVPLTATVTVPQPSFDPATPAPSGNVVFLDGTTILSTVPLASGSATYTIPNLAPRNHAITAKYSGDAAHLPSTSSPIAIESDGAAAAVIVTGGSPQTITVGTAAPAPLLVEVTDAGGNPLAGQTVSFVLDPGPGGASATLSANSAITSASGIASVTATANNIAGIYSVIVSVTGVPGGAAFSLTNVPGAVSLIISAPGSAGQSGVVNTALALPLKVIVQDRFGNPVPGVTVTYTAPASGPSVLLSSPTATTIADGSAQVTATRNTLSGPLAVVASVAGATTPLVLTNKADVPASFTVIAGSPQTAPISTVFPTRIQAQAKDRYGNPTPNIAVTITAPSTGASANFSPPSGSTNATGMFTTNPIAGFKAGRYTVSFVVGLPAVTATVDLTNSAGAAEAMDALPGGSPQSAQISTAFADPLQVVITDAGGNPVPGVTVTFSAPTSGASAVFSPASAVTNAAGQATTTALANSTSGSYFVVASAGTLTADFVLTNAPGAPDNVTALTGSTPQSAPVGTAFGNPLTVVLRDSGNNPVQGVRVIFLAPAAGATANLSSDEAITDSTGRATVTVVAGTMAGSYVVSATAAPSDVNAAPLSFNLTNVAGAAATVSATGGSEQSAQVATAFVNALSALVTDSFGNPVSGALVTFSVPASGATATLSAPSAVTNASGVASVTATAGITAGAYLVTASSAGASPAGFALTNSVGPPDEILINSGNGQSVPIGGSFAPLQVTVVDSHGNPVAGAEVTFEGPAGGASAVVTPESGLTNALGQISVAATATTKAGLYEVTVTATYANPAGFLLQNLPGPAATITATSGSSQSARIGAAFAESLVATVRDSGGNPVPGVSVAFAGPSSGASASLAASAVTDAYGTVATAVMANSTAGAYAVTATAAGVNSPASFTLTNAAGPLDSVTATSGTPQTATIGTAFALPLVATVLDASGNPISGVTVTFAAPATGASVTLSAPYAVTNLSGQAQITVTANNTSGSYYVSATVAGGLAQATFGLTNKTGAPASIVVSEGGLQTIQVGNAFLAALVAQVLDAGGNPVTGATVNFTAPSSGASAKLSVLSSTSDSGGFVRVLAIANGTPGSYNVTATVNGVATPATFSMTNGVGSPQNIAVVSGTPQNAAVGASFAPLVVVVTDSLGNPVSGVVVNFAAPSTGASASVSAAATTNGNGQATVIPIANTAAGTYTVTSSATGTSGPVSFILTNNPGTPAAIAITDGVEQSAVVTSAYAIPLTVRVTDSSGNPVPGATVNYAAPAGGPSATLSSVTATTDSTGQAAITATANGLVGEFSVSATVTGIAPVAFLLTNTVSAVAAIKVISRSPQTVPILNDFASSLVVHVVDGLGNSVPGVVVTFAAPLTGPSAVLSATSVATDGSGMASVTATANSVLGPYAVTATVAHVAPASFALTNSVGVGVNLAIVSGTPQTAGVLVAFAQPLVVIVTDAGGNPAPGATVQFQTPASGASAALSAATLTTNPAGLATATATANSVQGAYVVFVTIPGQAIPVSFSLTNGAGLPGNITALSGIQQSATVGTAFAPVVVLVTDAAGNAVPGVSVGFAAPSGGPSAFVSATVITNSSGQATVTPSANAVAGSYVVVASVAGVSGSVSFNFTNVAGLPASVKAVSGTPQTAVTGTNFSAPLQVLVNDAYGNPVSGANVTFSAPDSGASALVSTLISTTNASGIAIETAMANNTPGGPYSVTATIFGVAPAVFVLTNTAGAPGWISAISGTPQIAAISTAFVTPLQARVLDISGIPVAGATVNFASPGSGASATLSPSTATTDQAGIATTTAVANGIAGPYDITANTTGVAGAISFAMTNSPGAPAALSAASGSAQSAAAMDPFPSPLVVRLVDAAGNPIVGVAVTFVVPATGPSAILSTTDAITGSTRTSSATALSNGSTASLIAARGLLARLSTALATDAKGTASVTAVSNGLAGSFVVMAMAEGVASPAVFNLTNTAGPPAILFVKSGAPQSATINTPFSVPLAATVTDTGGNPVPGASVTFSAPPSGAGASFAQSTVITDALGHASVGASANGTAGTYEVIASVTGISSSAEFSLTNTPGAPSGLRLIAGTPQTATVLSSFGVPLTVKLADASGNGIPGAEIAFYTAAAGSSAILSRPVAVTDGSGQASVTAGANAVPGSYVVYADAGAESAPVVFSLANTVGLPARISVVSGSPQSAAVGSALAMPLTVKVADVAGNGIAGVAVTFSSSTPGASARLSTSTVTTDSSGTAVVFAIASSSTGDYEVQAKAVGIAAPAVFKLRNADQSLAPSPTSITFSGIAGTAQIFSAPLSVTTTGSAASFTVASSAPWLSVSPLAAQAPTTLTIMANTAGRGSGTYTGNVVLTLSSGLSTTVPVTLTLGAVPRLSAAPAGLSFVMNAGSLPPAPRQLTVSSGEGPFTATTTLAGTGPNWLTVSTLNSTLSATTFEVTISPGAYSPGTYDGTISIIPATSAVSPLSIPVTFSILAPAVPAAGSIRSVTNSASFNGAVAPGSLATVFGVNLSAQTARAASVPLPFELGGVTVTVGGKQAALLYVSSDQINFQVAVDVPLGDVQVVATNNGVATTPFHLYVSRSAPGIFLVSGTSHAAAQNSGYTANSQNQPAPAGDYVTLYASGIGLTTPAVATGQPGPSASFSLTGPIDVSIGGVPAQVLYSGLAPGLVGCVQINAVVPSTLSPGEHDVVITSGDSESNVATISVGPPEQ